MIISYQNSNGRPMYLVDSHLRISKEKKVNKFENLRILKIYESRTKENKDVEARAA